MKANLGVEQIWIGRELLKAKRTTEKAINELEGDRSTATQPIKLLKGDEGRDGGLQFRLVDQGSIQLSGQENNQNDQTGGDRRKRFLKYHCEMKRLKKSKPTGPKTQDEWQWYREAERGSLFEEGKRKTRNLSGWDVLNETQSMTE